MDVHVKEYYCQFSKKHPNGHFHQVIALHERPELSYEELLKLIPEMNRGWYELAHLSPKDRIEFIRDFWISKLPYHPKLEKGIHDFFNSLDEVGVFITQKMFDSPYEAHLVYSLKNNNGFFHGEVGCTTVQLEELQQQFPDDLLPEDYLAFLQIHNGFCKSTDTGIIPAQAMAATSKKFQEFLSQCDPLLTPSGKTVDPQSLIPFYESFGLNCYHCFWADWYPEQEMGNVYYSGQTHSLSDCSSPESSPENLAFCTFSDWLLFYLEKVE
jgi:hypothetical protein